MKDKDFAIEVETIIHKIAETIEDHDLEGKIDVDLNDGILTLVTDYGIFVINKQSAAREIWLSSPVSGPYHFASQGDNWRSRTGAELFEVLSKELQIKIVR